MEEQRVIAIDMESPGFNGKSVAALQQKEADATVTKTPTTLPLHACSLASFAAGLEFCVGGVMAALQIEAAVVWGSGHSAPKRARGCVRACTCARPVSPT